MNNYMKREEVESLITNCAIDGKQFEQKMLALDNIPSADVVEAVYCRYCKWSRDTGDYQDSYFCDHPSHNKDYLVHSRFYCGHGERKDTYKEKNQCQ